MPVLQRTNIVSGDRQARLAERLEAEWENPQNEQPIIIEERPQQEAVPNHLYVVWQEWEDLSPLERSRLILQAYERYRGRDLATEVTLAMGLTPDEARHMNLKF